VVGGAAQLYVRWRKVMSDQMTPERDQPAAPPLPGPVAASPEQGLLPLQAPPKLVIPPSAGEVITSGLTGSSYTMGEKIGEGNFGMVYACRDTWENDLAAKVLKPFSSYEAVKASATAEVLKLVQLRNPYITYMFDAFEYRDTFYIITERCYCPLSILFELPDLQPQAWIMPIARCILQAVHYIHLNNYVHQDIHFGNVFASFAKDEMVATSKTMQFKLGDLGVAKLVGELDAKNTRAAWMLPPEVIDEKEFGKLTNQVDLYHLGLLFLQIALRKQMTFTREEILHGKPRELALSLPAPLNFALEKALRRHVQYRTATAMELWRDLHSPSGTAMLPSDSAST
jgi:serine/threonine-protein kinase